MNTSNPNVGRRDYVIVVQAPAYKTGPDTCALESAFATHLKELRAAIGNRFARLVLVAPEMSRDMYAQTQGHLDTLSESHDQIRFVPVYSLTVSRPKFLLTKLLPTWRLMHEVIRSAAILHSGMSTNLGHPVMAIANLVAWRVGTPVVFMVDIDFRTHSRRYYETGQWSFKSYLVNRYVYDPLKWIQVWLAPRMFQLVYLKSASMVRDFGKGRCNVHNFYDTVHSGAHVLDGASLEQHIERIQNAPVLQAVYFGRFASNKGVDRMIEAVKLATAKGARVHLTLIGTGDSESALRAQIDRDRLGEAVKILSPVPYGSQLFELLADCHVCLAAPLSEDTPRAAFDAMARGLPIVAFDITYFRDLAEASAAVNIVRWPSAAEMAEALVGLARDRAKLATMARSAVEFARANTQEIWLDRRTNAMLQLLSAGP